MNNKGFSLIEVIVVIAIAAVAVGAASITYGIVNSRNTQKAARNFEKAIDEARTVSMAKGEDVGKLELKYYGNILCSNVNGNEREICNSQVKVYVNGVSTLLPNPTEIKFNTAGMVAISPYSDFYFIHGSKGCKVHLNEVSGKAEVTYY